VISKAGPVSDTDGMASITDALFLPLAVTQFHPAHYFTRLLKMGAGSRVELQALHRIMGWHERFPAPVKTQRVSSSAKVRE